MLRTIIGDININVSKTDKIPVLLCSSVCVEEDVKQTINKAKYKTIFINREVL